MNKYKNKLCYLVAALIPIIIMLIAFCVKGVWFDGEKLAFGDMQAQYSEMILYFRKVITGEESIFYSITKGLGGDMYATLTYYMLSPFNLIALFFKESNIMQAIYFIILGKIGLSGLTMYIFLNSKNKNKIHTLIFSTCYSLMAFVVDGYFCIMWLDAVYMAPLILFGIDKLINEKKIIMYMITLALAIIFNFYMGYIICIFSVIYFVYKLCLTYKLEEKEKIKSTIFRFIISSIFAGLATSCIWLISIIEILKTSRDGVGTTATLISVIRSLFIGSYDEKNLLNYYQPNLYCGILVNVLLISYFFNKKNTKLERGISLTIIAIFIASIFIPILNYFCHGFSYPIGYNFRFAYLFDLFLILIANKELEQLEFLKKKSKIALVILCLRTIYFMSTQFKLGWITLVFLIIYTIILSLKINRTVKDVILFIFVIIEFIVNTILSLYPAFNQTTFEDYYNDICKGFPDNGFYRISGYDYYGIDETIGAGKSSTKGFYSTINNNIVEFYLKVGYTGGANVYDANQNNTPIVNSILGVKYIYNYAKLNMYELEKEIKVKKFDANSNVYFESKNYIYRNDNALSLGYMIEGYEDLINLNPFQYQNNLLKKISGNNNDILLEVLDNKENNGLKESKYIYVMTYYENNTFSINNVSYNPLKPGEILAIENNFGSDELTIVSDNELLVYYLDEKEFQNSIEKLKENQLENIEVNKNKITGNIKAENAGTLMLSIPYENGINIYVDGKKTEYHKIYDMFIGIDIEEGEHEIKIEYKSFVFIPSVIISVVSISIAGYFVYLNKKENLNGKNETRKSKK